MVETFRSLWGMGPDWETIFPLLKQQGFVGVEASIKDTQYPSPRFFNLLAENDLKWICGLYTSWTDYEGPCESISVDQHVKNFKSQVEILKSVPVKPIHVNCHSGSDEFSQEEAETYFNAVLEIQAESEFTYSHETHRGRILYSPWVALRLLKSIPDLTFTLDLSHWVVVTERLIPIETLKPILRQTRHIHARLGTRQRSQFNPKRITDEYRNYFESVWKQVLDRTFSTLTPEYGPKADEYGDVDEQELDNLIFDEMKRLQVALH